MRTLHLQLTKDLSEWVTREQKSFCLLCQGSPNETFMFQNKDKLQMRAQLWIKKKVMGEH